jgi:para-aminobenzoate N-oxygenase AurF
MSAEFQFTKRLRAVSDRDLPRLAEHFTEPAEQFEASSLGDHVLFPLEMTWFYGEPIWHALSAEQQLKLNRLTFCQSYLSTAVAEAATNVLNYEAALEAFIHADPEVALYMAREVVEETSHLHAFLIVIRKVLAHYGLTLDALRATNVSLRMASDYVKVHTLIGALRGDLYYYYFTRFPLNVNQKTVERCTINEPNMHPCVRSILRQHAIDEARHMQMSRETGKVALAHIRSRLARTLACVSYAHFAADVYIGRHNRDSRLRRRTRIGTLALCGVPVDAAERAYVAWRDRRNQPHDSPLVRAGRVYYLRQNVAYIDELDISERLRAYMKRTILRGYADAVEAEHAGVSALEFDELTRSAVGDGA